MKNLKVNWGLPIEMPNYFFSAHLIKKIRWFITRPVAPSKTTTRLSVVSEGASNR
jgi:hypothetical protein